MSGQMVRPTQPTTRPASAPPGESPLSIRPDGVPEAPPRTPWRNRIGPIALVTGLAVLTAVVHGRGMANGPAFIDDEGTYVAQAWAVQHNGTLAHYTYWYDHPPLGWMLLALWNWVTGPFLDPATAVDGGRQFTLVCAVVSAILIYFLGRRLGFARWAASAAVIAYALSPLAVDYSRYVYLDNIGLPFLLGAFVLALSPRRHLWAYMGSGLLLACAVLCKETLLLFAPAVLAAAWVNSKGRTRPFLVAGFVSTLILILLLYPVYALLKGELLPGVGHVSLYDAVKFQLGGRLSTGSILNSNSRSAEIVTTWLQLDPWLLGAGVLLSPIAVALRRTRLVGLAVLIPVLAALRPGYLPDPFVIALLPFCALVVAGLADTGVKKLVMSRAFVRRRPSRQADGAWRVQRRPVLWGAAGIAVVAIAALVASGVLISGWSDKTSDINAGKTSATTQGVVNYVSAGIPTGARVLIDDTLFVDLVDRGFDQHTGAIWFYKLDFTNNLDPSVQKRLPNGIRDIDYVIYTPVMRSALDTQPGGLQPVREAVKSFRRCVSVGTGPERIQILQNPALPPCAQ